MRLNPNKTNKLTCSTKVLLPGVLLLFLLLFSSTTILANAPNPAALEPALNAATSLKVGSVQTAEEWAFASLRGEGEATMALAHWDGSTWHIALDDSAQFAEWLPQLPESLIPAAGRVYLQPLGEASMAVDAPNLHLPFPTDQTWRYIAGPNGGPKREYVAFGPLGFNEPAVPHPPFTGREKDVTAADSGVVIDKGQNFIVLRHHHGWETVYRSLAASSITHRIGDLVERGQLLGLASDEVQPTYSVNPHADKSVHVLFGVRRQGVDQIISGQRLSGWQVFQDNSFESGHNAGRIVFEDRIEKIDCGTVAKYQFDVADCRVQHFPAVLLRVNPDVTTLPHEGNVINTIEAVNVHHLKEVKFVLNYDPDNLLNPIIRLTPTPILSHTIFENAGTTEIDVDTVNHLITFRGVLTEPFSGAGSLLNLKWLAESINNTPVRPDKVILAFSHATVVDDYGSYVPLTVRDGWLQIIPNYKVEGRIELQGPQFFDRLRANLGGQQVKVNYDGRFSVQADNSDSATMLTIDAPYHLMMQLAGPPTNWGDIKLLGGDVTDDEQIDVRDLAYMGNQYNGTDSIADINGDGKVDLFDITIVAANYGQHGPINMQK